MDIKGIFAWILIIFATISLFAYVIGGIVSSSRKKKSASPDTVSSGGTNEPVPKEETSQEGPAWTDAGDKPEDAGTQEKKISKGELIAGTILIILQLISDFGGARISGVFSLSKAFSSSVAFAFFIGQHFLWIIGIILIIHWSIRKAKQ